MDNYISISIIVPVYNVEKYLPYCLESISRQHYEDYELILVDDGSTDKSGKICDDYKDLHNNVIVVHQKNQGLSAARNNGAAASRGKYITFMDSDDVISEYYLSTLVNNLNNFDADISVGRILSFVGEKQATIKTKERENAQIHVYNTENALEEMLYGFKFGVQGPCKLYKRELVINNPYPVGKLHEDQGTTYKIIASSKKLVYTDKPLYFYRQRSGSIVHTHFTQEHLYGLNAAKQQLEFVESNFPGIVNAAKMRIAIVIFKWIPGLSLFKDRELFKSFKQELLPYYKTILSDKRVTKAFKIKLIATMIGFLPAKIVFKIFGYLKILKNKNAT